MEGGVDEGEGLCGQVQGSQPPRLANSERHKHVLTFYLLTTPEAAATFLEHDEANRSWH